MTKGLSTDEAGLVCPKGDGTSASDWTCSKCGDSISDAVLKEIASFESELKDADVGTIKFNDLVNLRKFWFLFHN